MKNKQFKTEYDTTSERYSHLSGLTDDEIRLVMFTADVICKVIETGRKKRLAAGELFRGPPGMLPGERYLLELKEKQSRKKKRPRGRPRKRKRETTNNRKENQA